MSERIKVKWQVSDGYICNGTHTTVISIEDILDSDSEEEVRLVISECIQDDFEQKVSPEWDSKQEDVFVDAWRKANNQPADN